MKNLLFLAVVIYGAIQAWEKLADSSDPIYNEPYVAVYGRNSCGFTQRMLSDLKSSGVNYHYFTVDDKDTANKLHARMESSGLSTRRYNLPVVDTNGSLKVRPKLNGILAEYSAGL